MMTDEDRSIAPDVLIFARDDNGSKESVRRQSAKDMQEAMNIQENLIAKHILKKNVKGHFRASPVRVPDIEMGVMGVGLASINAHASRNRDPIHAQGQSLTPNHNNPGLITASSPRHPQARADSMAARTRLYDARPHGNSVGNSFEDMANDGSSVQPTENSQLTALQQNQVNPRYNMGMNLTRITEFQNEINTPHGNQAQQMRNTKYSQGFDLGTGADQGSIIEYNEPPLPVAPLGH